MTRTPDARAGELFEDDGIILGSTAIAAKPGEIRFNGTRFSMVDSSGEFDPRTSVSLHAPTHSKGGSDEVLAQNLGSGAAPAGKLLQSNGTGGWDLVDYPSSTPELNYDSYTTPYSTSSGTYQQVWRYTTPALSAGEFIVIVQADLDTTNAGNVTDARVQIDDTTTIASWIGPVAYVGGNKPLIGIRIVVFTAGTHNIDFDVRKAGGNGNVIMKACYVQIWKVE